MDVSATILTSPFEPPVFDIESLRAAPPARKIEPHEKYNTEVYKRRVKDRNIQARRILLLLEYRCMGKVGLRQSVRSLFQELGLLHTTDELSVKEAALDYLKGLSFIDLAEESKYHRADKLDEHLKQKTYGITIEDDIVLTFGGVKECEIIHKPWFFRYTDRTIQHMDSFSNHTGLWMVLAAISILGYFVSL